MDEWYSPILIVEFCGSDRSVLYIARVRKKRHVRIETKTRRKKGRLSSKKLRDPP
jgi:hypothetical protein